MGKGSILLQGAGLGAGLMYLLDPELGRRRRALLRDQAVHAGHAVEQTLETGARDLRNRATGILAETRAMLNNEEVSDAVLVERIRARLGHCVTHPHAIHVTADNGYVTLSGPILAGEVNRLLESVFAVRGVFYVNNQLDVHADAIGVPGLQGGSLPRGTGRKEWTPAARLLVGAAGGVLLLSGAKSRGLLGTALRMAGTGLLASSCANCRPEALIQKERHREIVVQSAVTVEAPIEHVFGFWTRFDNYARFLSYVHSVRDIGHGHLYWRVTGPEGIGITWEAVVTRLVPRQELAWMSVPGSLVEMLATARFHPEEDGSTHVHLELKYYAGESGARCVPWFLGSGLAWRLKADLLRMKTLIEAGAPHAPSSRPAPGAWSEYNNAPV